MKLYFLLHGFERFSYYGSSSPKRTIAVQWKDKIQHEPHYQVSLLAFVESEEDFNDDYWYLYKLKKL